MTSIVNFIVHRRSRKLFSCHIGFKSLAQSCRDHPKAKAISDITQSSWLFWCRVKAGNKSKVTTLMSFAILLTALSLNAPLRYKATSIARYQLYRRIYFLFSCAILNHLGLSLPRIFLPSGVQVIAKDVIEFAIAC